MDGCHDIALGLLTAEHAATAAALIRAAFTAQSVITDPPPSALRECEASVAQSLTSAEQGGFAVRTGGTMAGCVLWQVQPRGLYLGRLAVHPAHRGRGIAAMLVGAVEDQARRLGLPRVLLSTRLMLADNRRLFARCGFVETAEHAHPGYDRPTFVDMEKEV